MTYANEADKCIYRISIATLVSFISRALSTTDYFCYPALSSAGVVLVLPGYAVCAYYKASAIELELTR